MAEITKTGSQAGSAEQPGNSGAGPKAPESPSGVNLDEAGERFLSAANLSKDGQATPRLSGDSRSGAEPGAREEGAGDKSGTHQLPAPMPFGETSTAAGKTAAGKTVAGKTAAGKTAQATLRGAAPQSGPKATQESGRPLSAPSSATASTIQAAASTIQTAVSPSRSGRKSDLSGELDAPVQPGTRAPDADAQARMRKGIGEEPVASARSAVPPSTSGQKNDLSAELGASVQPGARAPDADARARMREGTGKEPVAGPSERKASPSERKAGPNERKRDSAEDAAEEAPVPGGDRVLHGLQAPTGDVQGPDGPADAARDELSAVVEKLADRILVSEPQVGQPEVRIKLNVETLEGTEISLKRDAQGLSVAFDAPSLAVAQRLDEALPQLQRVLESHQLEKHQGEPVRIQVNTEGNQSDTNQSGDGRSRNRRDLREELLDQD